MNSQSRPQPQLINSIRTWEELSQLAYSLLETALQRLYDERHSNPNFPDDETEISLCLSGYLRRLVNEHGVPNGLPQPSYDSPQGRDNSLQGEQQYEKTKPDVRWMLADLQNVDIDRRTRAFDVECKRVGLPASNQFNRKYVTQGIVRFGRQSHRYGAFSAWGVMIGYLQNSDHDTILTEINQYCASETDPDLTILGRLESSWQPVTSHLTHRFDRPFPVTPYLLSHLWVDLRSPSHS